MSSDRCRSGECHQSTFYAAGRSEGLGASTDSAKMLMYSTLRHYTSLAHGGVRHAPGCVTGAHRAKNASWSIAAFWTPSRLSLKHDPAISMVLSSIAPFHPGSISEGRRRHTTSTGYSIDLWTTSWDESRLGRSGLSDGSVTAASDEVGNLRGTDSISERKDNCGHPSQWRNNAKS